MKKWKVEGAKVLLSICAIMAAVLSAGWRGAAAKGMYYTQKANHFLLSPQKGHRKW